MTKGLLPALAVVGMLGLASVPVSVLAQEVSPAQAYFNQLESAPAAARAASERLGVALARMSPAAFQQTVSLIAAQLGNLPAGPQQIAALRDFAAGVTAGLMAGAPAQASQLVSKLVAQTVAAAGQNEGHVGLVARVISAGVVDSVLANPQQTAIPLSSLASLVQSAVSTGASQVVGREVVVAVMTTSDKPVSDVSLSLVDGQVLSNGGQTVTFSALTSVKSKEETSSPASPS